MRIIALIPLALLTSACWTPGPGQLDPTRYPWDPRNRDILNPPPPHPRIEARGGVTRNPEWDTPAQVPVTAESSYCVMMIEQEVQTGISLSTNVGVMACTAPPNTAAAPEPASPPK